MTYNELSELIGGDAREARIYSIDKALDRKKSRDGETRVKLDLPLVTLFLAIVRGTDNALDEATRKLHEIHNDMARPRRGARIA
jgi:hypothetical protein